MPATNKILIWLKRAVVLGAIVLWFVLAAAASRRQHALGTREDIEIRIGGPEDLAFVTQQQVYALITAAYGRPVQGERLSRLQLDSIERIVLTIPHVRRVAAHVDLRGQLGIDIVQKRPLARVLHNSGVSYYLDSEGFVLPLSDNFTAHVVVITGALTPLQHGQHAEEIAMWKDMFNLVRTIGGDRFASALVEEIHREPSGEILLVPKLGDFTIRLGQPHEAPGNLRKLHAFYERSVGQVSLRPFESIDLRFEGQVVCKKRSS